MTDPADLRAQLANRMGASRRPKPADAIDELVATPVHAASPPAAVERPAATPPARPTRSAATVPQGRPRVGRNKIKITANVTAQAYEARRSIRHWALDHEVPAEDVLSALMVLFVRSVSLQDAVLAELKPGAAS